MEILFLEFHTLSLLKKEFLGLKPSASEVYTSCVKPFHSAPLLFNLVFTLESNTRAKDYSFFVYMHRYQHVISQFHAH